MDDSDDDYDMDVENAEGTDTHPQIPAAVVTDSELEVDSDDDLEDDDLVASAGANQRVILLPSPLNTATSANSFWSTLIPATFLPGVSSLSATRISRGTVSKPLRVFSVAMLPHPRPELENGGKMILPQSFLLALTQRNTQLNGPMLFRVSNDASQKVTHCGVLEFIAEEGRCYMPYWRMHNIGANEGDMITVENITAQIGKFALFEPQSVDFLDISNPTALLENALRNFACITKGEIIVLHYNGRIYELKVLDTKPADVLNIIECDMDVDFAPAVGLPKETSSDNVESAEPTPAAESSDLQPGFVPFIGAGSRLNGKPVTESPSILVRHTARGQADFEWKAGNLQFSRKFRKSVPTTVASGPESEAMKKTTFLPFQGPGMTLKKSGDASQPQ